MYQSIVFSPPMCASLRSFKCWSTAMYFLLRLGGCDPASSWTATRSVIWLEVKVSSWNKCPMKVFFEVVLMKMSTDALANSLIYNSGKKYYEIW